MVFRTSHLVIAVLLHVVVLGFLFVGFSCSKKAPPPAMIQASLVSAKPQVKTPKREESRPDKEQEKPREEKKAPEREQEIKKAEAEDQRKRDELSKLRVQAEAKKKAIEDARKQKEEAERRRKDEQAKREEDNRKRQKERELEDQLSLLQQMDAEDDQRQNAANAGKQNEWVALIQDRVKRNWLRPPAVNQDFKCKVRVELLPGGQVVSVRVLESSGIPILDDSVERAVRKSDPLPTPADPRVFERTIDFYFTP